MDFLQKGQVEGMRKQMAKQLVDVYGKGILSGEGVLDEKLQKILGKQYEVVGKNQVSLMGKMWRNWVGHQVVDRGTGETVMRVGQNPQVEWLGKIFQKIDDLLYYTKSGVTKITNSLKSGLTEFGKKSTSKIGSFLDDIGLKSAGKFFHKLGDGGLMGGLGKIGKVSSKLLKFLYPLINAYRGGREGWQEGDGILGSIGGAITGAGRGAFSGLMRMKGAFATAGLGAKKGSGIGATLGSFLGGPIGTAVGGVLGTVFGGIIGFFVGGEFFEVLGGLLLDTGEFLISGIGSAILGVVTGLWNVGKFLVQSIWDFFKWSVNQAVSGIVGFFKWVGDKIPFIDMDDGDDYVLNPQTEFLPDKEEEDVESRVGNLPRSRGRGVSTSGEGDDYKDDKFDFRENSINITVQNMENPEEVQRGARQMFEEFKRLAEEDELRNYRYVRKG